MGKQRHIKGSDTKACNRDEDEVESNNGCDYTSQKGRDGGGRQAGRIEASNIYSDFFSTMMDGTLSGLATQAVRVS